MADIAAKTTSVGSAASTDPSTSTIILYFVGIAGAIPLGYLGLKMPNATAKLLFNLLTGLGMLLWIAGSNAFFPAALAVVVFLFIRVVPQQLSPHGLAFAFMMTWCLFYRTSHWVFPDWPAKNAPTGAIMMIMQYRVVSAAFDVCGKPLTIGRGADAVVEASVPTPSALTYFSYTFSVTGLVAGPVITFRDYVEYIAINPTQLNAEAVKATTSRAKFAAFIVAFWVATNFLCPTPRMETLMTGWQGVDNAVGLSAWLARASLRHRFQFYAAWLLCELGLMLAGIGTTADGGYTFSKVQNIEPIEIEINSWYRKAEKPYSIAHQIKFWNMSIQRWLVRYVYRRFPVKFFKPLVTMMVSAYLHGIATGFYVSFVFLLVLDVIQKKWMNIDWSPPLTQYKIVRGFYLFVYYMILLRSMEVIIAPFHAPFASLSDIYTMWESFGFYVHIGAFIMMVMILIMPQKDKPLKKIYSHVNIPSQVKSPVETKKEQ